MTKVYTFSVPPDEIDTISKLSEIKKYCKKTGVSFSFLVAKKIKELYTELGLDNGTQGN